ncbi:UDP-glucosyltransferase 2-like [Vanessa tameamea]|uniref:UDP-glucosyltransferase 2-like n=1 Tax=Vanessa tameamea TaxID=334116 RepID=A0A8B8IYR6_VANTA
MLKLAILLYFVRLCNSSKILVVFPVPEKRHGILSDSLVKALLEEGHELTYVTKFPQKTKVHNLKYVDISSNIEYDSEDYWPKPENTANNSLHMENLGLKYAQRALLHPNMQELMMNTTCSFDLIIAEWFYSGLLAPLSPLYECPLIWYSSTDVSWKSIGLVSSEVNTFSLYNPGLTIIERIHNIWTQLNRIVLNYYHISSKELPAYEKSFRDAFNNRERELPNYETVVHNSSLLFINSHAYLDQISGLPTNAKYIGGHHMEEVAQPLPKNLKKIMDECKDGVIYVDLETRLFSQHLQEFIMQELIEAFGQIKQTVIWKYDEILVNLPKNLYTMKKPPQQSILSHANTVALVSHADMVSIIEAAHYGVPVIGIPVMEDQIANMDSVIEKKWGVKIDFNNKLSWKILDAIDIIESDKSFLAKAAAAQSILRYRLTSPRKEFQHWIQMIINTRGAPHLRSSNPTVSTLEKYNIDIILLLIMLLWFFSKVIKVFKVHFNNNSDDLDKKDL